MKTVDANYILRYLLADVPEQYETAKIAFEKDRIQIPNEVLAETIYDLSSDIGERYWPQLNWLVESEMSEAYTINTVGPA